MEWTPELNDTGRELWQQGMSAREIGGKIGRTKNSVISRAQRSDWGARRPHKAKPKPVKPKPAKCLPKRPKPALASASPKLPETKMPFLEATAENCKFILGDRSPWMVCGATVKPQLPYCAFHCRICYGRSWNASPRA